MPIVVMPRGHLQEAPLLRQMPLLQSQMCLCCTAAPLLRFAFATAGHICIRCRRLSRKVCFRLRPWLFSHPPAGLQERWFRMRGSARRKTSSFSSSFSFPFPFPFPFPLSLLHFYSARIRENTLNSKTLNYDYDYDYDCYDYDYDYAKLRLRLR